ncbi:hypothetical protein N8903_01610 [Pelagibacterales bacterium]|nr:hypothetical protein [Pelagibacterales bacterium]
MKKIIIVACVVFVNLLLSLSNLSAKDLYPGQSVSGQIGKFGLGTNIILPEGNWVVAGVGSKNGTIRPAEFMLIQATGNKIKSVMFIRYARDFGRPQSWDDNRGWRATEIIDNNTCDDYDDQKSNFHYKKVNKKKNILFVDGSCMAVYALNDIYNLNELRLDNSIEDTYQMAERFMKQNQLIYPNALIFIDNTFFSKDNYVQIYYGLNPEFRNIDTLPERYFTDSDWHKYNIDKYSEKSNFMDEVIYFGKRAFDYNVDRFSDNKPLDFYTYGELN